MKLFLVAVFLVLSVVDHLTSGKKLRWCTLSPLEQKKCSELSRALLSALSPVSSSPFKRVSCILAHNTYDCINKIRENKADAVSLDAGDVYSAVKLYGLTVVAKEIYLGGSCVFAVAVAKCGTLDIQRLKGVRSCHNGARWTSGWNIPMGFLLARSDLMWFSGRPLSQAINGYFNASCIPGIGATYPKLCALCQGPKSYIWDKNHFCETNHREPFYGSEGAFRCLKMGLAEVAFLDHFTVMSATDLEREEYELLCPDGSTAPLTAYSTCNLGSGPGRAIVTRHNLQKTAKKFLKIIQHLFGIRGKEKARFELFTSAPFRGRDLLFHDATQNLQLLGEETEISQILGLDYVTLLQGLGHEGSSLSNSLVRWCCISDLELHKCEEWALNVRSDPLVCVQADSMIGCIELIKKNEADAVTLDATHAYFAETCTLAPVAAEFYGEECAPTREELDLLTHVGGLPPLYSVALVRKANQQISRYTLRGKRSCHSHVYSPGGWLLLSQFTAGALEKGSSTCNLTSAYQNFFGKGCMPGANGNLCKVCIGQEGRVKGSSKCAANHHERYYGNLGALRCLLGDPTGRSFGDVALLEHHNLLQNIEYLTSSGWATGYSPGDFELLCPDGSRAAITAWRTCNLGCVPPSIVVTRPVTVTKVQDFLLKSQESSKNSFQLFESLRYGGNDLLFKDATQGLVFTGQLDFKSILGQSFFQLAQSVFSCTSAGILDFCELDTCTSSTQP
ncbi:serotransferrin-2-like isoform X2 [Thamnophis elegans]|uniref:serotransferrin-2-like isoform X2 n=1 Tax=Thamnophis elegans TaxID=35005 RepID=UPI0013790F8A|nr:serotransferrin-2-like isoform X2 [Thamnophis elegans]